MVDGIERELQGEARVVRLDTMSRVGREVAAQMAVRGLPTLVVTDGDGELILRQVGAIRRDPVVAAVRQAGGTASEG